MIEKNSMQLSVCVFVYECVGELFVIKIKIKIPNKYKIEKNTV